MNIRSSLRRSGVFCSLSLLLMPISSLRGSDEFQTWSLNDGVEVLLLEDHRAKLVDISIYFDVNVLMPWAIENDAGLIFSSQIFDPGRKIKREIEHSGVSLSTGMGWAWAQIRGSSLATDFPQLIKLIRETIQNRDFDRKEITKLQRDQVIAWKASSINPRNVLYKAAISLLYPSSRDPRNFLYDRPKSIRVDDAKFGRVRDAVLASPTRYVAVSGAISKAEVHALIHDLLPPRESDIEFSETDLQPVTFSAGESKIVEHKNLTQVYMALIRDSLPLQHESYSAYLIVNQILGGTFSSRLYQKLRHETGDTYSATLGSWYNTATRPGMLILQTYTRTENADDTERRLKEVLEEVFETGVTENEVAHALAYLRGSLVFSRQTPNQIVTPAATNLLVGLPVNFREISIERAAELTLDEINAFAQDFYDPSKFAIVKVVPKS